MYIGIDLVAGVKLFRSENQKIIAITQKSLPISLPHHMV